MSGFKDKLRLFLQHFENLETLGEDADNGYTSEFVLLKQQTQQYKESNTYPADTGQQPYNKKKNRFKDILPYEYTRVQLHKAGGVEGSDYINANYIQGADGSVKYIAAQGPLPHTVEDFWRMLWYHQIEIVVMACKLVELGRKKCEAYWPEAGEPMMCGAIKVTLLNEESISDDFTVRELLAECQGEEQVVRQYHYSAWPDHGRPVSALPIIRMIERIGDHRKRHDIPVVVHCSAGCGRTGTIIAIDYARSMILSEEIPDDLNVYNIIHDMRKQRPSMVQAKEQYIFVYLAIAELVRRNLDNVPQAPPKQLKFEKAETQPTLPPANASENIYANLTDIEQKRMSTGSIEQLGPTPKPPLPLARTSSAGKTEGGDPKPTPPTIAPRPTRSSDTKTDTHSNNPPEPAPRHKKSDTGPTPIPRTRPAPTPPVSGTPSTSTPLIKSYGNIPSSPAGAEDDLGGTKKGYVNVPGSVPIVGEGTYSTIQKPPSSSSLTKSTPTKPNTTSNTSILDMFVTECKDVMSENDLKDLSSDSLPSNTMPQQDLLSYSLLGTVSEEDIPPDVPLKTVESNQLLVGQNFSASEEVQKDIYEMPDPISSSTTLPPPNTSTSIAFSTPKPIDDSQSSSKSKKGGIGNRFKKAVAPPKTTRTPASSTMSPTKQNQQPPKRIEVNEKYQFPGKLGFGVRIGKPKGPRPIPSHWNIPNGLVH